MSNANRLEDCLVAISKVFVCAGVIEKVPSPIQPFPMLCGEHLPFVPLLYYFRYFLLNSSKALNYRNPRATFLINTKFSVRGSK